MCRLTAPTRIIFWLFGSNAKCSAVTFNISHNTNNKNKTKKLHYNGIFRRANKRIYQKVKQIVSVRRWQRSISRDVWERKIGGSHMVCLLGILLLLDLINVILDCSFSRIETQFNFADAFTCKHAWQCDGSWHRQRRHTQHTPNSFMCARCVRAADGRFQVMVSFSIVC